MVILDLVWPALYIAMGVYQFWFLILLTIGVEAIFIKYLLKVSPGRSLLISLTGNLSSSIAGTFVMMLLSILYHLVADSLFFESTFDTFNWIASFIIMCFGSIIIEILTVKLIWKYQLKELMLPLSIGNVIGYLVIIFLGHFESVY